MARPAQSSRRVSKASLLSQVSLLSNLSRSSRFRIQRTTLGRRISTGEWRYPFNSPLLMPSLSDLCPISGCVPSLYILSLPLTLGFAGLLPNDARRVRLGTCIDDQRMRLGASQLFSPSTPSCVCCIDVSYPAVLSLLSCI